MEIITYTAFRNKLAGMLQKVNRDRTPLLITRQNGESAVVMSHEDFKSYEETAYLMSSTANARRLQQAIDRIESGKATPHDLIEP